MLREIVLGYSTGAIHWCKRFRPEMVKELATIQEQVKELARKGDMEGVKEELARCRKHVQKMIVAFKVKIGGRPPERCRFISTPCPPFSVATAGKLDDA